MATLIHGYFLVLSHMVGSFDRAGDMARSVTDLPLLPRERRHIDALGQWAAGDLDAVATTFDEILVRWPTDILALRLQHFLLFNAGRLDEMLASTERARSSWEVDLPRMSYLDGMAAFALEELGRYENAEELGRRAVAADATDLWSVHAVAHVLEMQRRVDDGLEWLDGRDDVLHSGGAFASHIWWHKSLYHLACGDVDTVGQLYDSEVFPTPVDDGLTLTNAISLLARLHFDGIDVGDRWAPLADKFGLRLGQHTNPFNDCHFVMGAALAGLPDVADQLVAGMDAWTERDDYAAGVIDAVGLATAQGLRHLETDPGEAARLLGAASADRWKLGGSHAQRSVFALAASYAEGRAA
jgi:tetratricopeptide (TPR) repeat protein